jgi:replication factor C small subunit
MAQNYQNLWIEKYRPVKLEDLVLQSEVRNDILKYVSSGEIPHLLFYGDAGSGKTTLSRIIVNELLDCQYLYINASDENGIDTVRGKISDFAERKSIDGKIKVIVLDEVDGFSPEGQRALRNIIEEHSGTCRFILTCNYIGKVISPIISRCISYKIEPPISGFIKRCAYILKAENVAVDDVGEFVTYIKQSFPDTRLAINCMQRDSLTGSLIIKKVNKVSKIVSDIIEYVLNESDPIKLRKLLIERASEFNSDYRTLMHDMFNGIYDMDISVDKKRTIMLELSAGLYKHEMVMDKEINCYATLLKLLK